MFNISLPFRKRNLRNLFACWSSNVVLLWVHGLCWTPSVGSVHSRGCLHAFEEGLTWWLLGEAHKSGFGFEEHSESCACILCTCFCGLQGSRCLWWMSDCGLVVDFCFAVLMWRVCSQLITDPVCTGANSAGCPKLGSCVYPLHHTFIPWFTWCTVAFWHVVKVCINLVSMTLCMHKASLMGKRPVLVQHGAECSFFINMCDIVTESKLPVQQAWLLMDFFLCLCNTPKRKSLFQKIWAGFLIFFWILTCLPPRRHSLVEHGCLCSLCLLWLSEGWLDLPGPSH